MSSLLQATVLAIRISTCPRTLAYFMSIFAANQTIYRPDPGRSFLLEAKSQAKPYLSELGTWSTDLLADDLRFFLILLHVS